MEDLNSNHSFQIGKQLLIDNTIVDPLIKILDKYCFFDLSRAIFCFNSWRYTRPHLQFYLTLNYILCHIKTKEECKIESYEDFKNFINEISPYYNGVFDDDIIPDFGEIKIPFNNKFYSVILGTGHDLLFPFIESLEASSRYLKIEKDIQDVLEYVNDLSNTYGIVEPFDSKKYDAKKIVVPTKKYFETCFLNYKYMQLKEVNILSKLTFECQKNIEISHFIKTQSGYLPLFNPSIIVDAFDYLYKEKNVSDIQKINISNNIIYDAIYKNFDNDPRSKNLLFNVCVVKDKNQKTIYNDLVFNYVILFGNSALFLINSDRCTNKNIDNLILTIKQLKGNNDLQIIEPVSQNKCKLINLNDIEDIGFIMYDNYIQLNAQYITFSKKYKNIQCCTLYDLVSIIYYADNIENIIDFFNYLNVQEQKSIIPLTYAGYAGIFHIWEQQNEEILQGADEPCNIVNEIYILEWAIFKKFIELEKWYPFENYSIMFSNPFSWKIEDETLGFKRMISNCVFGFCGCFRKIKNSFIFIVFNLSFEKNDDEWNKRSETFRLVEELIERNVLELENTLIKSNLFCYNGIQLAYMPIDYAKKIDNAGFLNQQNKYVFSDMSIYNNILLFRFAINEDKIFNDILYSKDRSVECDFMNELFLPLKNLQNVNFSIIEDFLKNTKKNKKNIETLALELEYVFSHKNLGLWPTDKTFIKVRKFIANECKNAGIKSKTYTSSETTNVIRAIQKLIIPKFEEEIAKYNQVELHKRLLSIVSFYLHQKRMEMNRYNIKNSELLTNEAKSHTAENIINIREKSKEHIRDLYYLIDTNLSIKHDNNSGDIENKDLEYLIAFAHWLLILQDCSDEAYYNLFGASIDIEEDFTISTNFSEEFLQEAKDRNKRSYDNVDYNPILQDDKKMFEECLDSFLKDTGVHLECIIQICKYLSKEFSAIFSMQDIPDVYMIKKQDLINDYESILIDKSEKSKNNFLKALDYLIIEKNKIKQINGSIEEFVPVWEREKRDVRFEVRPIVSEKDYLIFSPIVMFELSQLWIYGTLEFYPPYEVGLLNYCHCLDKWKSLYEKQMETDIYNLFNSLGYKTYKNLFLHKFDKKSGYPQNLGDYDVLAFDINNKTIWNIESKFLGMVGSLKEYYNHQDSFFNKDKKDEKFANRILYLSKHKANILKSLGLNECKEFSIKNFMVTNKVFYSDLKKIDFTIITFYELKKMLGL